MFCVYELPTPTSINFQHILTDPSGGRTGQLAGANAARAAMRTTLKECHQSSSGEPDWFKAVKVLEDYLPHLLGLIKAIETDVLLMPNETVFVWSQYELVCVLLALGLAIANTASSIASSIGPYELGTETDRRAGDEKLSAAVDALCRASGLFEFLSQEAVPEWEKNFPDGVAQLRSVRPPELSIESTAALAQIALADAERFAIRRLLSRSSMDRHTNPGGGLPKSHPSPALLAKLDLNVHKLYSSAKNSFKLSSGTGEISGSIRDYVKDGAQLALGRAYKWLAVDAGEKMNRPAEAVGWLHLARESLKTNSARSVVVVRSGSITNDRARRKGRFERELEEVNNFHKAYEQLNRTITFEPVPPSSTLLARIPSGRSALSVKKYTLPSPLSKDFRSACGELDISDLPDSDDEECTTHTQGQASYALKDSYY